MAIDCQRLKDITGSGLLAFPVTHFREDSSFDEGTYRASLEGNVANGAVALFAPGGTGEFFALTLDEYSKVVAAAVAEVKGRVPVIGGVGYGTAMAVEFAKAAERAGADGILVLPPYLLNVEQEGLFRHLDKICSAVGIGVFLYNRDNAIFASATVARLAEKHKNLIGFKDGHGDVEQLVRIKQIMGDRLVYVGGMPTAEVFAVPYFAAGFSTYSSAVYNFVPKMAQRFYKAVRTGDSKTTDHLLKNFFIPYIELRNRKKGYAVSIVKAGMRLVGRPAGPVRSPLTDLDETEMASLKRIMTEAMGDAIA
jgi:5-dehydro-4-deoxyglucarate dehydratase